jgi:hypothetical protein
METIINDLITPSMLFIMAAYVSFSNNQLIDFLIFGVPWAIFVATNTYIICCTIIWHLGYFHIICYYFTLIIKRNYDSILKNRKIRLTNKDIIGLLRKTNKILLLIHQFNEGFWNKYSAIMFMFYNSFICTLLYETFFVDSNILVKLLFGYMLLIDIAVFSCYIISATLVSQEAKRTLKVFDSVYNKTAMPIMSKLKVCSNISSINFCF